MKTAVFLVLPILAISACHEGKHVGVTHAWVRLAAVSSNPSAAYFTIVGGSKDTTLTSVSSPAAARTEMHQSMSTSGMSSMAPLARVAVRANSTVEFAPNGKHVMLFGLTPDIRPGGTIALTVRFANGEAIETQAKVIGPADSPPEE